MKRLMVPLVSAMVLVALAILPIAAAPQIHYRTFGSATVTEGPAGTFTIVSDGPDPTYDPSPEYGGVYVNSKSNSGKAIGSVSFSFVSSGEVAGGAPRFSIPIDTDGVTNTADFYAFMDVAGWSSNLVSTESSTCQVSAGSETFANWAALAAAHPTYRIAPGSIPFIIADGTLGRYVVSNIVLR